MPGWQEIFQQAQLLINTVIRFVKARRREEASVGLAVILFYLGYNIIKWLPEELQGFVKSWYGDQIIQGIFYVAGLIFLLYGIYRIWKLVHTDDITPYFDQPLAIKGPLAFTEADGELFWKLGRKDELQELLSYVEDNQVRMVVLMGASGAGKTSLLRAGLTHIIKDKNINCHYWEAVPSDSGQALLRAIQESWKPGANGIGNNSHPKPESLEDLINPSLQKLGESKHIIVLDQFEQLHSNVNGQIFKLLQKTARKATPPYLITWIIAFRREFRADWSEFMIPEQNKGFYPREISLRLFTSEQAKDVISQLIAAADLKVEDKVVGKLVETAAVEGEVSSIDIGIGLLILSELFSRQGGKTVTEEDYNFAGGAEGLLTQYIGRCLNNFPDEDRETIMNAMLSLRDPETSQRIATGKTANEISEEVNTDVSRLKIYLERLTQRDIRLLEYVATEDINNPRYRLPHERFIPALNRMRGRLIGELEEIKQRFTAAFSAWSKNNASQYLLKGKDLRFVELYKSQIPWGKEETAKLRFLKYSKRRRTLKRLLVAVVIISLTGGGWFGNSQYQRYTAQNYLLDNSYPPELFDYQHQLNVLKLNSPFNTRRFPWLQSNTLEELEVKTSQSTNSLDGFASSLARCPALKKLSLVITSSQISDLDFLKELKNLKQLNLDIGNSKISNLDFLKELKNLSQLSLSISFLEVSNLDFLKELPNLDQLSLNIGFENKVSNLDFLKELKNLNQLNLNLNYSKINDLDFLKELKNLNQLSLDIDSNKVSNLDFLKELPNLTQLSLNTHVFDLRYIDVLKELKNLKQISLTFVLSENEITKLDFLKELKNLNQLSLDIEGSEISNLDFLKELKNLTQLSLNIADTKVSNLNYLKEFPNLNQLSLNIRSNQVINLDFLKELKNLTQLYLDNSGNEISNLDFLKELKNLTQLSLNISRNKVSNLDFLKELKNLNQLTLNISDSEVGNLDFLRELKNLKQLSLTLYTLSNNSKVTDLSLLLNLNCQILELKIDTDQRMSLKTIPNSVMHLNF